MLLALNPVRGPRMQTVCFGLNQFNHAPHQLNDEFFLLSEPPAGQLRFALPDVVNFTQGLF